MPDPQTVAAPGVSDPAATTPAAADRHVLDRLESSRRRRADAAWADAVDDAIIGRRSIRRFLPTPVARETIEELLAVAARAPSGTNTQPWRVHVVVGAARDALAARLQQLHDDPAQAREHREPYAYYPREWFSPYVDRRRHVGWALYGLLGIGRDDKARMHEQHGRNYAFFDAPVGLVFTIDARLEQGSWLDYGMYLQSLMVAARSRGLDTCPQAAFTKFHRAIAEVLQLGPHETVVCAMSLGHADPDAPENALVTPREPVVGFVRYVDALPPRARTSEAAR